MEGEAYADIVWKEFRKNRPARRMLAVLGALVLVAILAPAIASNQPFWFKERDQLLFPWFIALFNPDSGIDFVFNVALMVLLPWMIGAWILDAAARRAAMPGRRRVLFASLLWAGEMLFATGVLAMLKGESVWVRYLSKGMVAALGIALAWGLFQRRTGGFARLPRGAIRSLFPFAILMILLAIFGIPRDKYFDRDFKKDQVGNRGAGIYPPIPYGPQEIDLDIIYKPPLVKKSADSARVHESQTHWMGTDDLGRDVMVRLLYGTRISLTIGLVAVSIYVTIGIVFGALAGYFGGWVDMLISRLIEIVLLFPSFFLILTLVALIGPSLYMIMIVIGLTSWPGIARLMRGEFLKQRSIDYVPAARALGASNARVMFRHILPNALSPVFVSVPFGIAGAITIEAGLSVLGFGARPPAPSWGAILSLSFSNYEKWWLTVFAGLAIFFTMTVFNVVGNGLRDAMDPRLKGTR